ncbi:MAG: hypothetical protein JO144_01860, partial [Actinobacteria bacterium]|nr:hypothetical protein [Actinomycetota bacterium]
MSAQLGALGAAWKHSFRQAAAGSGPYTRGLALYRAGAVPQAHADAGLLLACVRPKNGPARRARITVPMTSRSHRQVLAARLAADPRALAALLAGKLPAHLAACDPDTGTPGLVPEPSELGFSCTCQRGPAIGLCDHSAALGHALADRLTSTPTLMLTARGLSTTQLADDARALIDGAALVLPADRSGAVHAEHAYALWHHHTGGPDPRPAEPELDEPVPPTIPEPPEPAPSA